MKALPINLVSLRDQSSCLTFCTKFPDSLDHVESGEQHELGIGILAHRLDVFLELLQDLLSVLIVSI